MHHPISPAAKRARDRAASEVLKRIQTDRSQASRQVAQMLVYIEDHLFEPINVTTLRQSCGIHDNTSSVRFHQETGQPPKSYISSRRLEIASRLLWETNLKIWQIGLLVGYSSIGVFSKAFLAWSGERPMASRRRQTGTTTAPQEILSSDLSKRALNGSLDSDEARDLIQTLHQLYPDAGDENHAE